MFPCPKKTFYMFLSIYSIVLDAIISFYLARDRTGNTDMRPVQSNWHEVGQENLFSILYPSTPTALDSHAFSIRTWTHV